VDECTSLFRGLVSCHGSITEIAAAIAEAGSARSSLDVVDAALTLCGLIPGVDVPACIDFDDAAMVASLANFGLRVVSAMAAPGPSGVDQVCTLACTHLVRILSWLWRLTAANDGVCTAVMNCGLTWEAIGVAGDRAFAMRGQIRGEATWAWARCAWQLGSSATAEGDDTKHNFAAACKNSADMLATCRADGNADARMANAIQLHLAWHGEPAADAAAAAEEWARSVHSLT